MSSVGPYACDRSSDRKAIKQRTQVSLDHHSDEPCDKSASESKPYRHLSLDRVKLWDTSAIRGSSVAI